MSEINTTQVAAMLSAGGTSGNRNKNSDNWFESMASAWGSALNNQATRVVEQSDVVASGMDTPAEITQLTAESLKMSFISNSSHTSLTAVGTALETLARKQ